MPAVETPDEAARQAALRRYGVLDTPTESEFDEVVRLASRLCGTPIALVTLLDRDRQWFKAEVGAGIRETPRDVAFCDLTITEDGFLEIPDLTQDPRTRENPLLQSHGLRFYAGVPLRPDGGPAVGTLCVLDREPRRLDEVQREVLRVLARQVTTQLELRRRLREAAEGEERLSALFARSRMGKVLADANRRIVRLNQAFGDLLGYAPEDLIGRSLDEITHPDDVAADWQLYDRLLESPDANYGRRKRYLNRDGGVVWVDLTTTRIEADGQTMALGEVADATAEVEAQAAQAEQARLLDLSSDAILVRGPNDRITYWNRGAEELYGYSREEAIGRTSHDLLQTEFSEPSALVREQLHREGRWSGELVHTRRDGTRIRVGSRWSLDRDAQGRPASILETNNDVTARREAEDALRRSEIRYRAFVANSSEGVYRLEFDPPVPTSLPVEEQIERLYRDGRIAECNDVFARMYGYAQAEELVGKSLAPMLPADDPNVRLYLQFVIANGYRASDTESEERDRHGNVLYFSNSIQGVVENGQLLRAWGVQRDVTERKRAEAQQEETRRTMQMALEVAEAGTWRWNLETNEVMGDESLAHLFGQPVETTTTGALTADRFFAAIHPEDLDRVMARLEPLLASGGEYDAEFRVVRPNGSPRWLTSRGRVEASLDGLPERVTGLVFDVTPQKRAALDAAFLADLGERIRLATDADTLFQEVSEATYAHLAASRTQFVEFDEEANTLRVRYEAHDPDLGSVAGEHEAGVFDELLRECREGRPFLCENTRLDARTAPEYPVGYGPIGTEAFMTVPFLREGRLVGMFSADSRVPRHWTPEEVRLLETVGERTWNAAERLRLDAELRASEARFRAVQETSVDGFMVLESVRDEEGGIVDFRWAYANEAAERIIGRPRTEFLGKRLLEEMPGNREEGLFDQYVRVVETGEPFAREFIYGHEGLDAYLRLVAAKAGDGFAVSFADLSERRRAEEKVRESERRFRELADDSPMFIWVADPDGQLSYSNRASLQYLGYEEAEYTGREWEKALHPDDLALVSETYARSSAERQTYTLELRLREAATGEYRWFLMRGVPRWVAGEFAGFMGTGVDIHDRKEAEERLRSSEERLALANRVGRSGSFHWSAQTDENVWSDEILALYGLSRQEFGGTHQDWLDCLYPEDREAGRQAVAQSLETGEFALEFRILRRDTGEVRWMDGRGQVFFDGEGRAESLIGINVDITDRKRAEAARETSEATLSAVLDALPVGVIIAEPDGKLVRINRANYELWGASPLTQSIEEYGDWIGYWPETGQRVASHEWAMARILERGESVPGDLVEIQRFGDGERRLMINTGAPVRNEAGEIVAGVIAQLDVTARVRAEQALREANENLEREVARRTEDLVAKNQELEGFTYTVAHDLRSPLRAMVGNAAIVLEEEGERVSAEGRESLQRLAAAAKRMGVLVDDLLQYARYGARELRLETVDLTRLVELTADEVRREHPEAALKVQVGDLGEAEADPRLLGMALFNLLDNACKYRKPGSPAEVAVIRTEVAGERAFCVRDRGMGFDMAYVGKLFQPFERLHRDEVVGTGIGLANVKRAIERHRGRVWAEGAKGEGATFWFTLNERFSGER